MLDNGQLKRGDHQFIINNYCIRKVNRLAGKKVFYEDYSAVFHEVVLIVYCIENLK